MKFKIVKGYKENSHCVKKFQYKNSSHNILCLCSIILQIHFGIYKFCIQNEKKMQYMNKFNHDILYSLYFMICLVITFISTAHSKKKYN